MGYYKDQLNKISIIESQGFNPYTESYASRIGQLDAQSANVPPEVESVSEAPKTAVQTPVETPIEQDVDKVDYSTMEIKELIDLWRGAQADVTKAFQDEFSDVDVAGMLRDVSAMEDFGNSKLGEYFDTYSKKYGEKYLSSDKVLKANSAYYDLQKEIRDRSVRHLNPEDRAKYLGITAGSNEKYGQLENVSYRNLLEQKGYGDNTGYEYLKMLDAQTRDAN